MQEPPYWDPGCDVTQWHSAFRRGGKPLYLEITLKTKKLKKKDVGRYVRVLYEDIGAVDGIITQVDGPDDFRFMPLNDSIGGDQHNNGAPAIKLGRYVSATDSGLD